MERTDSSHRGYLFLLRGAFEWSPQGGVRNLKIIEMGLLQVAKAIAEGKVKPTVSDLDKLIRLEEFLREEKNVGTQTKLIVEWVGCNDPATKQGGETSGPGTGGACAESNGLSDDAP